MTTSDNPLSLAGVEALRGQGRLAEALVLCDALIARDASDEEAALTAVRLLHEMGETVTCLRRLIALQRAEGLSAAVAAETTTQILHAAHLFEVARSHGDIPGALAICDALVDLRPGRSSLLKSQYDLRTLEAEMYQEKAYLSLRALMLAYKAEQNSEAELAARLEMHAHPRDLTRTGVERVDNIFYAISRLLGADQDRVPEELLAQTRALLADLKAIPRHRVETATGEKELYAACFDRWYRLILDSLDLDRVFCPSLPATAPINTRFALADGTVVEMAEIAERCRSLAPQVAFYAATSPEYAARYAEAYVRTMLAKADCSAVVFVLFCCPFERFAEVIADFPIRDPRLFFACDGYDGPNAPERVVRANEIEPIVGTHHYAVSALLRLDHLLDALHIPVFVTGIDTVLQTGVADLLEKFADHDVVLNKIGSHFGLGGQIVNNLSLTFPTPLGFAFVGFLKAYVGPHLAALMQPAFIDQLDLHMAKHHIGHQDGAKIGFFDEMDINNLMFDGGMVEENRDILRRYRFINIFATGCEGNAIDPDDL